MQSPTDKAGLHLVQYIPGEVTITAPLSQLLWKDNVWQWQHEHEDAVKKLKIALRNAPALRRFDPKKQLIIQADVSKDGLRACLLQEGHPIACASRALTETKNNYAWIEKELLAIVFSVKRFLYGVNHWKTYWESYWEQLLPDLQRILLQQQRYDLNVTYTWGKDLLTADTLSRAVIQEQHTAVDDITDKKVVYALEPTDATEALE